MSGFSDAGGGDVKGKASSFVGCNVVGVEVSLEALLECGVCQKGQLDGFVVWWWLDFLVSHDLFKGMLGHGSVGFFNVLSNAPEQVQFIH